MKSLVEVAGREGGGEDRRLVAHLMYILPSVFFYFLPYWIFPFGMHKNPYTGWNMYLQMYYNYTDETPDTLSSQTQFVSMLCFLISPLVALHVAGTDCKTSSYWQKKKKKKSALRPDAVPCWNLCMALFGKFSNAGVCCLLSWENRKLGGSSYVSSTERHQNGSHVYLLSSR